MELLVILLFLAAILGVVGYASNASKRKALERKQAELAPVKKLAFEDITALGVDLQELDYELSGHQLDEGQNADYQRALDAYERSDALLAQADNRRRMDAVRKLVADGRAAAQQARVASGP